MAAQTKRTRKTCDECEGEEQQGGGSNLRERIWETQLSEKREIYLNAEINDAVIEMVVCQIQNISAHDDMMEETVKEYTREPIKLFINTNGGELYSALSVCAAIEASRTPVHTIALGKALSAGFIILVCGDQRYAQKYSTLMYHTGSSGAVGVITDIVEEAQALEHLNSKIHKLIVEHTNITDEQMDEVFYRKNNWYIDVEEALELGVIDGIHGYEFESEEDEETCGECGGDCDTCTCYDDEEDRAEIC